MIRSDLLAALPGIRHVHTERSDGPAGGRGLPGTAAVRAAIAGDLGCGASAFVVPSQVHGNRVVAVTGRDAGVAVPAADGLVTTSVGVALLVLGADCPLVAVADAAAGVVGVAHSGWRGTAARIAAECVAAAESLGARRDRLRAAVFPGIGPCCFEVGPDVVAAFRETFGRDADAWIRAGRGDRAHLDLRAAIAATLAACGVEESSVDVLPGCTACGGVYFSHRASGGAPGRHGLAITLADRA